jgi:hypothetical protein
MDGEIGVISESGKGVRSSSLPDSVGMKKRFKKSI